MKTGQSPAPNANRLPLPKRQSFKKLVPCLTVKGDTSR